MARFTGKSVIMTGAGRGIGRAAAIAFAREGASVALAARTESQLAEVSKEIEAGGGRCIAIPTDIGEPAQLRRLLDRTIEAFGGVDIVVNNAAVDRPKLLLDCGDEEWDEVLAINLRSAFVLSRDAAKHMISTGRSGRIVNISTINVRRAEPHYGAYAASKGGMESLTMTMAAEWGPYGITVNAVAPGSVFTAMNNSAQDPAKVAWKEKRIPVGRIAKPEEISPAILFFASDEASYVTGQILLVDGGSFINANRDITWGPA